MPKSSVLLPSLVAIGVAYALGFLGQRVRKMLSRISRWCVWGAWGLIIFAAILYRGFAAEQAAAWAGIAGVSSLGLGAALLLAGLLTLVTEIVVENLREARKGGKSSAERAEDLEALVGQEGVRRQRRSDRIAWLLTAAGFGVAVFMVFIWIPSFAEVVLGWMRLEHLTEGKGIVHGGNYSWIALVVGAAMLGAAYWLRRL